MHHSVVHLDGGVEGMSDALMPEADTQNRALAGKGLDDLVRLAGFPRRAGTR